MFCDVIWYESLYIVNTIEISSVIKVKMILFETGCWGEYNAKIMT